MKEFDFVKLTLWLAAVLTAGLAVLYVVLGNMNASTDRDIRTIERVCKDVGLIAKDIKTLEDEKRNDKTPDQTDTAGINTFFMNQAARSHIQANVDYSLKSRDPDENKKLFYVDTQFQLDFKKDRPKTREEIFKFIYNCETQSRRIKLQKAKLTLDPDMAVQDLWRADSLTFVRRDPLKSATN